MNLLVEFIEEFEVFLKTEGNTSLDYFDSEKYVDFSGYENERGCYFIDQHYIGKTIRPIRYRIAEHLKELYDAVKYERNIGNKFKLYNFCDRLYNNKKIEVIQISDDEDDEKLLIEEFKKTHKLTNYEVNRLNYPDKKIYKLTGEALLKEIKGNYNEVLGYSRDHVFDTPYITKLKEKINTSDNILLKYKEEIMRLNNVIIELNNELEIYKEEVGELKRGIDDENLDDCLKFFSLNSNNL